MPRQPHEYRDIHEAEGKIHPRLSKTLRRSFKEMRRHIRINQLAMALAAGDVEWAMAQLPIGVTRAKLGPPATIVRDTFLRGGRIGAGILKDE